MIDFHNHPNPDHHYLVTIDFTCARKPDLLNLEFVTYLRLAVKAMGCDIHGLGIHLQEPDEDHK